jgi:hypothetical protein
MQFPAIEIATLLTQVVMGCCLVRRVVLTVRGGRSKLSTGSEIRLVAVMKCTNTINYPYPSADSSTCMSSGICIRENNSFVLNFIVTVFSKGNRSPLWSSGQSFWLQIQRSHVRFPALPHFLRSSGFGTGSTQPREYN